MEINETTMPLTWLCRLLGYAPYKMTRNKLNQMVDFKLSRALCVYGTTLMIVFSVSSNVALLYDMYSGHSLRYELNYFLLIKFNLITHSNSYIDGNKRHFFASTKEITSIRILYKGERVLAR